MEPLQNLMLMIHVDSCTDSALLHEAVGKLFGRHEQLRMLLPENTMPLLYHVRLRRSRDLSTIPALLERFSTREWALNPAVRYRIAWLESGEGTGLLACIFDSAVVDDFSLHIINKDLQAYLQQPGNMAADSHTTPYTAFRKWQSELPEEYMQSLLYYWRHELSSWEGSSLIPEFPGSRKTGRTTAFFELPAAATAALRQYSQTAGVELQAVLLTLVRSFLYRHTDNDDSMLLLPVDNRDTEKLQTIVGPLQHMVLFRTPVSQEDSFQSLLTAVTQQLEKVTAHKDLPYQRLQEALGDMMPEADVYFSFNERQASAAAWKTLYAGTSPCQLNFIFTLSAEQLCLQLVYDPEAFSREFVTQVSDALALLAVTCTHHISSPLSRLSLRDELETEMLIRQYQPEGAYLQGATVPGLFAAQVLQHGSRMALGGIGGGMTYRELDERSSQLAHYLINECRLQSEQLVGMVMERGPWQVIAILAILKAGGAYVPMDPAYPAERMAFMADDAGLQLVLTDGSAAAIPGVQLLDVNTTAFSHLPASCPEVSIAPHQLAYVIYTSGTTGQPKGVMVEHRNVVQLLFPDNPLFDFGPQDVWTQAHSYCFDFSVWEIFGALLYGGQLLLLDLDTIRSGPSMMDALQREGVTVLCQTPGAFRNLAQDVNRPLQVRYVIFGGEALYPSMLADWKQCYPSCRLINMYGITETTVHNTFKEIGPAEIASGESLMGHALPTLRTYVLDRYGHPVLRGGAGELYVGGDGVARGYLGRPELNAARFLPDMFVSGSRMYRSGDRVQLLGDGSLRYIGRIDKQVKIRGYRVEPGEIERVLEKHPAVDGVVVKCRGDKQGNNYLVAYVLSAAKVDTNVLHNYVAAQLPSYMVPSYFILLDSWPLTRNGKVDERLLPDPALLQEDTVAAVTDETEQQLLELWRQVLERSPSSVHDNFFESGGHSLSAMQLLSLLQRTFEVSLELRDIFLHTTIASQAALIRNAASSRYEALQPAEHNSYYAVSSPQKRLLLLHELDRGSLAYNMPSAIRLESSVTREQVQAAFVALLRRHENLRTSFSAQNGQPVQQVAAEVTLVLEEYDGDLPVSTLLENFVRPFDLGRAPLLRAGYAPCADGSILLLTDLHHIIADGNSIQLLTADFLSALSGEALTPLPLQYKDYAAWQVSNAGYRERLQLQRDYWLSVFAEPVEPLQLPTVRPRPAERDFSGAVYRLVLPSSAGQQLKALAREEEVTLFMLLLTLYNVLLSRLSGQDDIVTGVPVEGRLHPDTRQMAGMFVHTLPLRNHISGEQSFKSLLQEVKQRTLSAFSNQDYPYEQLLEELSLARDISRNPLFDVSLTVEVETAAGRSLAGKAVPVSLPETQSKFDLSLHCLDREGEMELNFQYSTALFDSATIALYASCMEQLIGQVLINREVLIAAADILPAEEKAALSSSYNRSGYADTATLPELFASQALQQGSRMALGGIGGGMTYRELDERSSQLAHYLINECRLQSEQLVGMVMERGPWQVITILAILKAGGAYVPMDPGYPAERMAFMADDAGLQLVLTDGSAAAIPDVQLLNVHTTALSHLPASCPEVSIAPHQLAYVIYTSGTTGQPKGVMVEHRNVVQLLFPDNPLFGFGPQDVWTQTHSYCFDVSVWEIFGALLHGGQLLLLELDTIRNGAALMDVMEQEGVTVLCQTPSAFRNLPQDGCRPLQVRYVIFAGEALHPAMLADWKQCYPSCRLINMYGITETTVHNTFKEIGPAEIASGESLIGHMLPTLTAYVLDRYGHPVLRGGAGELYVGGAGVTRGYLGRPELNAARFLPDMFVSGSRMYRSGDRVQVLEDGSLRYIGRIDKQVKIRGYRVEPGEIERVLEKHPEVDGVVVKCRGDKQGNNYLVAYVLSAAKVAVNVLHNYVAAQLPSYMVPSYFILLDSWPLTRNGKVDERLLPDPALMQEDTVAAVTDETEQQLLELWQQVLERSPRSVHDNFFESGGHSLSAMQLLSLLQRTFEVSLELRDIFRYATIASQAALIRNAASSHYEALQPAEHNSYYAVSSPQKRLLLLHELDRSSLAYNMPSAIRLESSVTREQVQAAFAALLRRHENLRTSFSAQNGQPVQQVAAEVTLVLEEYDGDLSVSTLLENFVRPFDLGRAPLLRAGYAPCADGSILLLTDLHHIIADGSSIQLLTADFLSALSGEALTPLPLQYKDYAAWQASNADYRERLQLQRDYWLSVFAEPVEPLQLPTVRPRPAERDFSGAVYRLVLPSSAGQQLKALAREEEVTLFMLLLTLYNVLLSRLSGQDDIVTGVPVEGRLHPDTRQMAGMFVHTLPLRNHISGEQSFKSLLQEVKQHTLSAFSNQDYPYEQLLEELSLARDISRNPLFDVSLTVDVETAAGRSLAGKVAQIPLPETQSKFDLSLHCHDREAGMELEFQYSTALFDSATIVLYASCMEQLIGQVLINREVLISAADILPAEEKAALLSLSYNRSGYPVTATLTGLFASQALQQGSRIALGGIGGGMTYHELDERSSQLAHYLINECRLQSEQLVGMVMERGPWQMIAILAILKAGGAYVPMDPAYTAERLSFMAADAGLSVVLTDLEETAGKLPDTRCIHINDIAPSLNRYPLTAPVVEIRPEQLAYVIYTSGTTGKPKGVLVEHRNLVQLLFPDNPAFDFTPQDVWTQAHSYCFDFSVWEIFGALLHGGRLVLISRDTLYNNDAFTQLLEEEGVTVLCQTPGAFHNRQEAILASNARLQVRYVILGGEALNPVMLAGWHTRYPLCLLVNVYGITETTIISTWQKVGMEEIARAWVSIGRPLPGQATYVLDRYRYPVLRGGTGELYVAGAGVARGYLGRPELNAARFLADTFVSDGRMYRSGDRVQLLEDGSLRYIGRIDKQVKIRGYRVEPGEIERVLENHPEVEGVVVKCCQDKKGNNYLAAYVLSSAKADTNALHNYVAAQLPSYMVPSYFMLLDSWPLTRNGKVDEQLLPDPGLLEDTAVVEVKDETEQQLLQLWSQVLDRSPRSVHDNFFESGGHSLSAMQLLSLLRRTFEVSLELRDIFRYATIASQAALIRNAAYCRYEAVQPAEHKTFYAVSSPQKRLLLLHELDRSSLAYNMPAVIRLESNFSRAQVQAAFTALLRRHENLCTFFSIQQGEPVQQVVSELTIELEDYDGNLPVSALLESFVRPFDLGRAPLLRAGYAPCEDGSTLLLTDLHHVIADGGSMQLLTADFLSALSGEALAPLPLQYKDYAAWQLSNADYRERLQLQRDYWLSVFSAPVEPLKLPADLRRPRIKTFNGHTCQLSLDNHTKDRLQALAGSYHTTMFSVCYALFNVLLSKISGQHDFITGSPVSGRHHPDTHNMAGMFVNMLPLRTKIDPDSHFGAYLQQVTDTVLQAMNNQDYPIEDLIGELPLVANAGREPLFDVSFSFNAEPAPVQQPGVTQLKISNNTSKYDLTVIGEYDHEQLVFIFQYNTDLFSPERIMSWMSYFKELITQVIHDDQQQIAQLHVYADDQEKAMFTPVAAAVEQETITSMFEKQVAATPAATALAFEDKQLSYEELNEAANKLAWRLKETGAGPETVIAIIAERSLEMIVAMLGVLKAGAAYLPVDITYPAERIQAILRHAGVTTVLATREMPGIREGYQVIDLLEKITPKKGNTRNPAVQGGAQDLAYMIFTSGSTGTPRGVMIEHHSIVNTLKWRQHYYGFQPGEVSLQIPSFAFDSSVEDIFSMLLCGGKLVMIKEEQRLDMKHLHSLISKHRVNYLLMVPGLYKELLQCQSGYDLSSLKAVTLAGDSFSADLVQIHFERMPRTKLLNEYGPTENSVCSTIYEFDKDHTEVLIGKAISGVVCHVLDKDLRHCPPGLPGKLYVSGAGLCRGYYLADGRLEKPFVRNPYFEDEWLYPTGDLAEMLPSGDLRFLGRVDQQVKIRGYRVDVLEVEAALRAISEIGDVLVLPEKNSSDESELRAYLKLNGEVDIMLVKKALAARFPSFMIPSAYYEIDALPLNTNGKVDRGVKGLKGRLLEHALPFADPVSGMEILIADVWKSVLGIEKVGRYDNFFDAGGNSMKAIRLANSLSETLGRDFPALLVFEYACVADMAGYLNAHQEGVQLGDSREQDAGLLNDAVNNLFNLSE